MFAFTDFCRWSSARLGWLAAVVFFALGQPAPAQQPSLTEALLAEPLEQVVADARRFGDPARGAAAFYEPTMNCARCHESGQRGRRLGPDLAEKREVDWAHLAESILLPSAKLKAGFETAQVALIDGQLVSGVLVEQNDQVLILDRIEQPEQPLTVPMSDVEAWKKTTVSSMPTGLANQLANRDGFLDLVAYLAAIADGGTATAARLRPAVAAIAPLPDYESHVDHAALINGWDDQALERGAETYRLRCASCHGTVASEGSMPTSLRFAEGKFKHGSDPYTMYQTLTHGYGMMNPQRWMVPRQKYEVIHYIREHFLKPHNPGQRVDVTPDYLASLPAGDTLGPAPSTVQAWTAMDYGPSLNNTIEVSSDGSNIAQKGIVVRLDDGPGGVESGRYWMLYEHDTLRLAAAWQGDFIDFEGIHFNGAHNRHPSVIGDVMLANSTGPGFARPLGESSSNRESPPIDTRFQDDRVVGRDGRQYGPLPETWGRFEGLYRFGKQTILKYRIGDAEILESPGLQFDDNNALFLRQFDLGPRSEELVIQIAQLPGQLRTFPPDAKHEPLSPAGSRIAVLPANVDRPVTAAATGASRTPMSFAGDAFFQLDGAAFDMTGAPFSIYARVKTQADGTLLAKTRDQATWVPQGQSLFLRNGRPTFDIGWVGAVTANRKIDDGQFHDLVLNVEQGNVQFLIDGQPAGGGTLRPESPLKNSVIRIGKTNDNFPATSPFSGVIDDLRFFQRTLSPEEAGNPQQIDDRAQVARWNHRAGKRLIRFGDEPTDLAATMGSGGNESTAAAGLAATVRCSDPMVTCRWLYQDDQLRLVVPPGDSLQLVVGHTAATQPADADSLTTTMAGIRPRELKPLTQGGPPNYPVELETETLPGDSQGPYAVDVFSRPTDNPWNCRLRLTGIDFLPDSNDAMVSAWDGSVWKVSGIRPAATDGTSEAATTITWRRFAYGLFQPLGIKVVQGTVYVSCRDQLAALHDLNGDGEADWYENFNSDHQVTEHFHEFAAGLQVDDQGRFYYAKCARHAKPAIVPQHGTLVRVSADGRESEILATGFRAPNGVCLNNDGTYFMTDQEGHWLPKNRINHVRPGGFYGNMLGYHDVQDESDAAMEKPVCWITNAFDRSPSEMMWVTSDRWGPLQGSLLNFSYGYGQIHVVPWENAQGQDQGGMVALPIPKFPTGIMRGRFRPADGQLYCCGMFAWAGNQQQPGGFYRVRYTGRPLHVPVAMHAQGQEVQLQFSQPLDPKAAAEADRYRVEAWDLKRSRNYGSDHLNQRRWDVSRAVVSDDRRTVTLQIDDLQRTRGMKIQYSLLSSDGEPVRGEMHLTIHQLD